MVESTIYIILALLGLGFLVFIHELGHYFVAKKVGMKVEVFSIGFGKPFFSWNRNGVKWQLCILPFGGYVKILGMEKKGNLEPHEIKAGFFSKRPIDRIKVLLAGPLTNIVFAFLVFVLVFLFGGRDRPFSEFTKKIGFVDQKSELYLNGVRPGDEIINYGGKRYEGFKDLMYASVMNNEMLKIEGLKVDYYNNTKNPFEYDLKKYKFQNSLDKSLLTIGIEGPANYIFYNKPAQESLMKDSNIESGDRIIWANGEIVFSSKHLSSLINSQTAFLTVKRGNSFFQTVLPKIKLEDVKLSRSMENEIDDWRHDEGIKTKLKDLYYLPYFFNEKALVENQFTFIDEQLSKEVSALDQRSPFSIPLMKGDKIVAVDGIKVTSAQDILKTIQKKHVLLIVQRDQKNNEVSWKDADKEFDQVFLQKNLPSLISAIGTPFEKKSLQDIVLLNPIVPISREKLESLMGEKENFSQKIANAEKQILKIDDPERKAAELKGLEASKKTLLLGMDLPSDKKVRYNPNPFVLFYSTMADMGRTLVSLVTGHLSPKWLSGPVGIVQVIQQSWSLGFLEALFWLGFISLNLGIVNLFPIPVFDGGYIVLSLYEMISKKRIKSKTMDRLLIPFTILLILMAVFFTYNDIMRIIKGFFH